MRSFVGKKTFSGNWYVELDNTINIFITLADMFEVNNSETIMAVPLMLSGDALIYYNSNIKGCKEYEEAMEMMKKWYNSDNRKAGIFTKW